MLKVRKVSVISLICLSVILQKTAFAEELVTLSQTVEKALTHNPEVNASIAQERAADQRIAAAKAGYYPSLTLNSGRGYEWTETEFTSQSKLHRQENSANVSQMIFDGFSIRNRVQTQSHLLNATRFQTIGTKEEVALKAIEAVLDIYLNERLITLAEENVNNHVDILKKTGEVVAAGAAHKGDLKLISARLALAQATYARYVNDVSDARAKYEAIVGEPFKGAVQPPAVPDKYVPGSLHTALTIARLRSPLLQSSKSSLQSSAAAKREARSGFYPKLTLEYAANSNSNIDGTLGESRSHSGMLKVSYNIFSGGSSLAALREAQEKEIEAEFTLEKTERGVIQQITTDWDLWQISNARLSTLRAHLEASDIVLQTYQEEFFIGKRQLFNVLDQQNELFQSKVSYQQGEVDLVRSAYRLLASMGQLIEMTVIQPPV